VVTLVDACEEHENVEGSTCMLQEESLAESGASIHVPEARDYSEPNQGYCTRGFDEELLQEIVCRMEGLKLVADCT
jgi:hypothetical protein